LATDQGEAAAQFILGAMYEEGEGVPQDFVQAHMWFNLAGASGNVSGLKIRDIIARKMTLDQIADAQHLARE
jgi:TPR repeat protein